ncbi:hypothetical protein CDO52_18450 [Nocardiopsis gilva YIM 90087]|uniref:Uncharacterized protein n=1 Tax=Nocardiopsis gilva YIM 90087 TaxID=1235441 RepID=A0A223S8S5_9ACTN|nr:hypothetical protein [Nocardiopsis gilva]ASU84520.1 hypothetical protein CDO52_18450 [Nocardiopsis gilva YIM 90087]
MLSEREALTVLRRENPEHAEDAAAAMGWLSSGGLEGIDLLRMQDFLWYALPVKWMISTEKRVQVAHALGRLLNLNGLERYAAVCESKLTEQILRIYEEEGHDAGVAAYTEATTRSGSVPTATPLHTWGTLMGPEENAAFGDCAAALDLALASGELRVGGRGWKKAREALLTRWLTQERPELDGACWLERIHSERLETWVVERHGERSTLAGELAPRLLAMPCKAPDPAPDGVLRALGWLLGHSRDRLPLTARHYIAPTLVSEAVDLFGWREWLTGPLNRELDVLPLHTLRTLAQREMRAIRRAGTSLVLTKTGVRMLEDQDVFWRTATAAVIGREDGEPDFGVAVREAALLVLLTSTPRTADELTRRLTSMLAEEGWAFRDGGDLGGPIRRETHRFRYRMWALGMLDDDCLADEPPVLTEGGEITALAALRARALRPRYRTDVE